MLPHFGRGPSAATAGRSGVHRGGALASTAAVAPSFLGRYVVYHQVGMPPRYLVYHQGQARWSCPQTPLSQAQVALIQGLPSGLPLVAHRPSVPHAWAVCCQASRAFFELDNQICSN
jgi:hypothetical protein